MTQDKSPQLTRFLGLLALFFVSALVGAASGIGVTRVIQRFALADSLKTEAIALANSGRVLGETDLQIAQTAPFFNCAKAPYSTSPACKGEHPRLHITQATLPYFREKIATYYKDEYQSFVNWVDANFGSDGLSDKNTGVMADYHALIYLLGPITGMNYPRDISLYGQRAIEIMMKAVSSLPMPTQAPVAYPRGSGVMPDNYEAMARAYDWAWNLLTDQQKTTIANWLADASKDALTGGSTGISNGKIRGLWSSTYFQSWFPWYYALSFYGDGIRDADAQVVVDSFDTLMVNGGWLDAQNWIARNQGGIQVGAYGLWQPVRHVISVDGWRTATGEDYFAKGTGTASAHAIQYYPQFVTYRIKPYAKQNLNQAGGAEWKFIKLGQWSGSSMGLNGANGGIRLNELLTMLESPLANVNPSMANLNRWLLENRTGDALISPLLYWYQFLWGDRSVPPKSPEALGLPKSQFFEGFGMAVMRTGFESMEDTAILVAAPPYQLNGHDWASWELFQAGFTIDKYGPLAIHKQGYLRGDKAYRKNMMRFSDPLKVPDSGFIGEQASIPLDVRNYTPGSRYDIGGMKRRTFESDYDYLYMDYTKYYTPDRVTGYSRQFVYLKPPTRDSSDYVVIFDRTATPRPDIIKRFEVNMAYNPVINGTETLVSEGKWEYTGGDQIIISNNLNPDPYNGQSYGAHGRLFIKNLLPEQKKIVKVGGPGHEFDYDEGPVEYPDKAGDYAELSQAGAFYVGAYYTDVIALQNNIKENFLHVLQTADTNNPAQSSAMTPTERIDGDTMVGAHIKDDAQGHKVVMFSNTEANQAHVAYSISASVPVEHLIADLAPFGTYDVYQDGKQLATLSASDAGTISFNSTGGGSFEIISNALPPTIVASAVPLSGNAPLAVSFTATATDLDGTIQSYSWNFGDNTQNSTQQNLTHTYSVNGTFTATVTVTDNSGLTAASIPIKITVTLSPKVTASADVKSGTAPLTVNFTAIGQNIVSYLWNFGDSQTGTQQNPTHTYQNSGTYTVKVTGTDSIGQITADTLTITVYGVLQRIVITPSNTTVQINSSKQFTATGYDSGGNVTPIQAVWSVSGGGSIDQNGLFTAGSATGGPFTITVQDKDLAITTTTTVSVTNLPSQGLIGYWSFDEGSGTIANDSSGNNSQGTIKGPTVTWTPNGQSGNALTFDGTDNNYVQVEDSASLSVSAVTVSMWIKENASGNTYLLTKDVSPTEYELRATRARNFLWTVGLSTGGSAQIQGGSYKSGEWTYVVGTWDGATARLYVNGVEAISKSGSGIMLNSPAYIHIGSSHWGNFGFNGSIDDVRIYNRALTDAEIQTLYNQPSSNKPPSITLKKTADKTEVKTGDTLTYTITYENIGGSSAINVVITDPIPNGTSYIQNSATGNPTFDGTMLIWTIPSIPASGKGSVSFGARVE